MHFAVGNLIEPVIFGHRLHVHPVMVLLSLAFWYELWDVPGAILAMSITAVISIMARQSKHPYAR